jgi:hypothetical protein
MADGADWAPANKQQMENIETIKSGAILLVFTQISPVSV